jgi:hypothetical protein
VHFRLAKNTHFDNPILAKRQRYSRKYLQYLSKFFSVIKGFERGFVETLFMHLPQLKKGRVMQSRGQLVKYHACRHFTANGPTLLKKGRVDRVQNQI